MKSLSILIYLLLFLITNQLFSQTDALTIVPNGNIGIGTTTPTQKLDVHGNIQSLTGFIGHAGLGNKYASFSLKKFGNQPSNYAILQRDDGVTFLNSTTGNPLYFTQGSTVKMVLDPNGHFGIGTTNPNYAKLQIGGGDTHQLFALNRANSDVPALYLGNKNTNDAVIASNNSNLIFGRDKSGTYTEYMRIQNETGNVGIGTNTPTQAKLVVSGNAKYNIGKKFQYFAYYGNGTGVASGNNNIPYSIYATDRIAAQQFNAFSDVRIKNIFGISNAAKDLETLSKIEITDYKMIDSITKGNQTHKKVIAQQVKKVYPQAVSDHVTEVIPNIYQLSKIKDGWIMISPKNLIVGDNIKLIFSEKESLVEVLEIKTDAIKVASDQEGDVFVYGKQVSDFHTVDYEAISMLNVSATQALLQRIESLEQEKKKLTGDFESYKKEVNTRLSKIEQILTTETASH